MARGWESKSVEEQQAEATRPSATGPRPTAAQAALQAQKDNLLLARRHILDQIEVARNPRHRNVLDAALADLDSRLKALAHR
jgi:hypothetical protein